MPARPNISAAALLAALALIFSSSLPADASARNHRGHAHAKKHGKHAKKRAKKIARWTRGQARHQAHPASGAVKPSGEAASTTAPDASSPSTEAPAARKDPKFGVFTDGSPYNGNVASIDALQGQLGRKVDIVNWYQSWTPGEWISDFHTDVVGAVTGSGRTPLLTWEPWDPSKGADQPQYRLSRIAGGAFDDYIASWADAIKATGTDVYLRPMHEMNGNWYPWGNVGDNTPELYVKAWRHMHDIFADRGVTNVKWVWCALPYSVPNQPATKMEKYYPGASYVDVLSLDGYNWGSKHPEYGGWQSFEQIFADSYKRLTKLGSQPIWLAEVGSAPQGGDKAQWVRDMWATARSWDRLEALVWFDQDKEEDWRALPVASAFAG